MQFDYFQIFRSISEGSETKPDNLTEVLSNSISFKISGRFHIAFRSGPENKSGGSLMQFNHFQIFRSISEGSETKPETII